MIHELKILPCYFEAILSGVKTFEVRRDDRIPAYSIGDTLLLYEYVPENEEYTGRSIKTEVSYILREYYVKPGYCIMSLKLN